MGCILNISNGGLFEDEHRSEFQLGVPHPADHRHQIPAAPKVSLRRTSFRNLAVGHVKRMPGQLLNGLPPNLGFKWI